MSAKQAAAQVFARCDNASNPACRIAVVLTPDHRGVRITKPDTAVCQRALAATPELFVGVYDINSIESEIYADLIHAGMLS